MSEISVIIPVSPYHIDKLPRALQSVRAQSIPCESIVIYDDQRRGAGYARNRGLEKATSPFVVFLDADDELMPTFAERCLVAYQKSSRYIFTDYLDNNGLLHNAPDCAWVNRTFHLVTTLLPLDWARRAGGFDETLAANEDADFYVKLNASGFCGLRLPQALVIYHHYEGERSESARNQWSTYQSILKSRYGGKLMGCCNDAPPSTDGLMAESVLVRPRWGLGSRSVVGPMSGIRYPRVDSSDTLEIDRRDLEARRDLWEPLRQPQAPVIQQPADFQQIVDTLRGAWSPEVAVSVPIVPPPPAAPASVQPNVERVVKFGAAAFHKTADPVFVFPDKDYPSYTDVRRLVELSGFKILTPSFVGRTEKPEAVIWLSPEPPPTGDDRGFLRHIWWSLEYGGEYEPNLSDWKGEVWASDPAWAKAHGAKMVVMGSHPGLKPTKMDEPAEIAYDYYMLAYQTARRQALQQQLIDLSTPQNPYPGYGMERHQLLMASRLMLHAHQDEQRQAIAPQRFALCAAYHLPLIHEAVPDEGAYVGAARFEKYSALAAATREELAGIAHDPTMIGRGEALHQWLCHDLTFEKSVRTALK